MFLGSSHWFRLPPTTHCVFFSTNCPCHVCVLFFNRHSGFSRMGFFLIWMCCSRSTSRFSVSEKYLVFFLHFLLLALPLPKFHRVFLVVTYFTPFCWTVNLPSSPFFGCRFVGRSRCGPSTNLSRLGSSPQRLPSACGNSGASGPSTWPVQLLVLTRFSRPPLDPVYLFPVQIGV